MLVEHWNTLLHAYKESPSHRISQFRVPGEWLGVYPYKLKWVMVFFLSFGFLPWEGLTLSPPLFFLFLWELCLLAFLWLSLFLFVSFVMVPTINLLLDFCGEFFFWSFTWWNPFTLLVKRKACSFKYHVQIVSVMS